MTQKDPQLFLMLPVYDTISVWLQKLLVLSLFHVSSQQDLQKLLAQLKDVKSQNKHKQSVTLKFYKCRVSAHSKTGSNFKCTEVRDST